MSKVLNINGHQPYPFAKGELNRASTKRARSVLNDLGREVRVTGVAEGYDVEAKIAAHQWADLGLMQFPVNWMGVPWSFKRYMDRQCHINEPVAARGLTAGLSPLWPKIHTVMAYAGYESKGLAQDLRDRNGWRIVIVKRKEQAFRIAGLNWIVERSFGWLGRHRRMAKDYEYRAQTSETLITIAACTQMIRQIAPN